MSSSIFQVRLRGGVKEGLVHGLGGDRRPAQEDGLQGIGKNWIVIWSNIQGHIKRTLPYEYLHYILPSK